jgi:hypothetical protein
MKSNRLPVTTAFVAVSLACLMLSSCGETVSAQGQVTPGPRPALSEAADPLLCGPEPLRPIAPRGVSDIPKGLSREQAEDAVSKALSADAENCLRTASYLFAKAQEPVEVVAKGVVGQCASAVISHTEHCNSLKWWVAKSVYPLEGEVGSLRLYCGANKEPAAAALKRLEVDAFTNVVRARAGRCWLLPVAK